MPLQKQVVSFQTASGVDTKNAPALVDGSKFLLLQNAVFDKGSLGQLHKRNGYNIIDPIDQHGNPITGGQLLATFNETELDLIASNQFYAQSPEINRFISKGPVQPIGVTERAVSSNAYDQTNVDSASLNGVGAYAWEDGRGGVWCTVIDEKSGTIFVPQVQLNAAGSSPKVISNGTVLFILCSTTGGQIIRYTVNPANPTVTPAGTGVTVVSGALASALFEVAVVNGYFAMAYQISIGFEFATFALSNFVMSGSVAESSAVVTSFSVTAIATTAMVVIGSNASGYVYFFTVPGASLSGVYGSFTAVPSNVANITARALSSTEAQVWYQQEPTGTADRYIETFQISTSGAFSSVSLFLRGVGLASQLLIYNDQAYLLVVYPSGDQQTYFLLNTSAQVLGKFYPLNAGAFSTVSRLPVPQLLSTGNYSIGLSSSVTSESVNGQLVAVTGTCELMLNMAATQLTTAQLGKNLHLSTGAMLLEYDGASVTEGGFNLGPAVPKVSSVGTNIQIVVDQASGVGGNPVQVVTLTFPPAPTVGPYNSGSLIIPGEYLTLSQCVNGTASTDKAYVWFSVDGIGSDPGLAGWQVGNVAALSTDTQNELVTKLYTVLNAMTLPYDFTFPDNASLGFVENVSSGALSAPAMSTQFAISIPYYGDSGSKAAIDFNCCAGYLLRPSEFMVLPTAAFGTGGFYFVVDGRGSQPAQSGTWVQVSILSTDSPVQVATKLASAMGGGAFTIGNQAIIVAANNAAIAITDIENNGVGDVESYSYCAVYERVDAQGQFEQSIPSDVVTVQLPPFTNVSAYIPPVVDVTVNTLKLTAKTGVDIAIYRTIANGDIFYRDSPLPPLPTLENNPTVDSVSFTDQVTDTILQTSNTLYTTGGVVENNGPPAFSQVIVNNNRLWGITSEDPQLAWFSQEFNTGQSVAWSDAQTMRFQPTGGPLVCLASMDSTLVAWETGQIWTVAGDGPDPTGNGQFSGPTLQSSSGGIRDIGSAALMPNGLMYKDATGFWLLNRAFQVQQIGRDVWGYNADIVSNAQMIADVTQIRFLSAAGTTLVYDYVEDQWGTFTNHQGVSSVIFNGTYYYLQASGAIYQEAPGTYQDGDIGYPMLIQTAWLKFTGNVQDYKRVWKVFFKGFFPDTNPIQVQTAYNYIDTIEDTEIWNPNAGAGLPVWGGDPTWGFSTPWGGVDSAGVVYPDVLQFRYDPNNQLCQSIQFIIQDLTPYPASETWSLDAIDVEIGLRKGGFKIGTQQRIG